MILTKTETISPKRAKDLLNTSTGNRPLNGARIRDMAKDMLEKKWEVNGAAIVLNSSGQLIDGHHRLTACVQANCPFKTVFVRGVKQEAAETIDVGAKRTSAHATVFAGIEMKNRNLACGTYRAILVIKCGAKSAKDVRPTNREVVEFMRTASDEFHQIVTAANRTKYYGTPSVNAAVAYCGSTAPRISHEEAVGWLHQIGSGENASTAVTNFRNFMVKSRIQGVNLSREEIVNVTLRCWNAHHDTNERRTRLGRVTRSRPDYLIGADKEHYEITHAMKRSGKSRLSRATIRGSK